MCILPQIDALESLVAAYPNAYLINTRWDDVEAFAGYLAGSAAMTKELKAFGYLSRFDFESPDASDADNILVTLFQMPMLCSIGTRV